MQPRCAGTFVELGDVVIDVVEVVLESRLAEKGVDGVQSLGRVGGEGLVLDSAEATFEPSVSVPVDVDGARKVFKLVDTLEESDDVQNVYTNVDVSDEVLAALDEE